MQLIVVSQDGKAFVDLDLTFCVKINSRHEGAFDILAVSGNASQWLGTYNTEDDAATMLSMLLVKKFDPRTSLFMMPKRDNSVLIDSYKVTLNNIGEKEE